VPTGSSIWGRVIINHNIEGGVLRQYGDHHRAVLRHASLRRHGDAVEFGGGPVVFLHGRMDLSRAPVPRGECVDSSNTQEPLRRGPSSTAIPSIRMFHSTQ